MLERTQLELPRAPARLRRGQEVIVLLEPEIEIPVGIQSPYRLSEEAFQTPKIFVHFGQLLARIREEIFDFEFGMMLPHIDGECRAVAPAGKPEHVFYWFRRQDATLPFPVFCAGGDFCI